MWQPCVMEYSIKDLPYYIKGLLISANLIYCLNKINCQKIMITKNF